MVRSIIGTAMMALGAITLIALILPGEGALTDWWRDRIAPWFGSGRWLLPFLLLAGGWYVAAGPGKKPGSGWGMTLGGLALAYVAALGAVEILQLNILEVERGGGRIGRFLTDTHRTAADRAGHLRAAGGDRDRRGHARVQPAAAPAAPSRDADRDLGGQHRRRVRPARTRRTRRSPPRTAARGRAAAAPPPPPMARGVAARRPSPCRWARPPARRASGTARTPRPASRPPSRASSRPRRPSPRHGPARPRRRCSPTRCGRRRHAIPTTSPSVGDSPPTRDRVEYTLPSIALLDATVIPVKTGLDDAIHARNEEIIVKKLAGFNIPSQIVGRNAGPVVTQYEVQPAPDIKVSRIEALSDDLAMALAARSLRIEAPIPGKSAVGIEIPNADFNIVALRRILEDVDFKASGSRLTFALGRDVAGKAQAVDLAKMPHLLIAGATGSGKSVMVNALITSLLCEATPDDVRMILMDLKRVELAAYNGLPHLLVPVITEPDRAKAALKWAVNEMEGRYRRLAGATARNIRAFNETRVDPEDRMPYIVIIIDELADLMMREGKNVEEPIVRLAQKARATGIHMVLATQRPSVNVVTGLIKANFPSRIAFAMASQIDSRTILDAPGAEDLIGRGDMLYQPSDLPRPMRLQGVFVSDAEIARIVEDWKAQIEDPRYDLSIIESDDDSTGSVDDLADEDADRLLPDAVEVIREYDRASASLLQRRLKVGYARAARMIDQLEARGYIGAFDGSNARVVLRREASAPLDSEDGAEGYGDDDGDAR